MGATGQLLPEGATLEQVGEVFANDRFATASCHPEVVEATRGHSVVRMIIWDEHLNGMGNLMGGVVFTLADFSFAIASNVGQAPTVTASCNVDFMNVARGSQLVATCDVGKDGRSLCFASVYVTDELGNEVARLSFVGARRG